MQGRRSVLEVSDNEDDPVFVGKDWVKRKKKFADVPPFVQRACSKAFAIPAEAYKFLPATQLSIQELCSFPFPEVSQSLVHQSSSNWFSCTTPTSSLESILSRPIPSRKTLAALIEASGQAYLDGMTAIIDVRYKDVRLPLGAIGIWHFLLEAADARQQWMKAQRFLDEEVRVKNITAKTKGEIEKAKQHLRVIPWGAVIRNTQEPFFTATVMELSLLLCRAWLNDNIIDLMVAHLQSRHQEQTTTKAADTVGIFPLSFSWSVNAAARERVYSKETTPNLMKYERKMKGLTVVYFPVNFANRHWFTSSLLLTSYLADSLGRAAPKPTAFLKNLMRFLKARFSGRFEDCGNTLDCSLQRDGYSCGVITMNTMSYAVLNDPLWNESDRTRLSVAWFNILVENQRKIKVSLDIITCTHFTQLIHSQATRSNENPQATPRYNEGSQASHRTPQMIEETRTPASGRESKREHVNEETSVSVLSSKTTSFPESFEFGLREKQPSKRVRQSASKKLQVEDAMDVDVMVVNGDSASDCDTDDGLPKKAKTPSGEGSSRSAALTRKLRAAQKDGTFVIDEKRAAPWRMKILKIDTKVEFIEGSVSEVRHVRCGRSQKLKSPYDTTRFRKHVQICPGAGQSSGTTKSTSKKAVAKSIAKGAGCFSLTTLFQNVPTSGGAVKAVKSLRKPLGGSEPVEFPCPGITSTTDKRIDQYVTRTGALGGGARSVTRISLERYNTNFGALSRDRKQTVLDIQVKEWRWKVDHEHRRVFSTKCLLFVHLPNGADKESPLTPCIECRHILLLSHFIRLINKPTPRLENYKHVNTRYHNNAMASICARVKNLGTLLDSYSRMQTTLLSKFADGVQKGQFANDDLFLGVMEVMFTKADKDRRQVGAQNFPYNEHYLEVMHIVYTISPRVYRFLKKHIPLPDERTLQRRESNAPKCPMGISKENFVETKRQVTVIGYTGPSSVACDDSKLLATFRIHHDTKQDAHFLVGGVEDPIRLANPKELEEILSKNQSEKATKLRLWVLQPAVPGISSIIIAAKPISEKMTVNDLFELHQKIISGLLDEDINICSYFCDGTENERKVEKRFMEAAKYTQVYNHAHPCAAKPDFSFTLRFYAPGRPIVAGQDSKHFLKTARNNWFSGAKTLTMGNEVITLHHLREAVNDDMCPYFSCDVNKVDKQDDAAAARLFSAATLEFFTQKNEKLFGVMVYLFIMGETVDAYQNREISHAERIRMLFRTKFFVEIWTASLEELGYSLAKHCMSREALDILPCEHLFGEARRFIPDFSALDFFQLIPKLSIKIKEACLFGKMESNPKARASGYCIGYFDNKGLDFTHLSVYPSDSEIEDIKYKAFDEAESLAGLVGISTSRLRSYSTAAPTLRLPAARSWFTPMDETFDFDGGDLSDSDSDPEFDGEDAKDSSNNDAAESETSTLHDLLAKDEAAKLFRAHAIDERIDRITEAAVALALESLLTSEREVVKKLKEISAKALKGVNIPSVSSRTPDEQVLPSDLSDANMVSFDLSDMVEIRKRNQTKQAKKGIRAERKWKDADIGDVANQAEAARDLTIRQKLINDYRRVLDEGVAREKALSTGLNRKHRWTVGSAENGNAYNAAVVAVQTVAQVTSRRKKVFSNKKITPRLPAQILDHIESGRVSPIRPLTVGDMGFALVRGRVGVVKVVSLYSKGGGKNGKHADVDAVEHLAGASYISVQVFEHSHVRSFRNIPDDFRNLTVYEFAHLPSLQFLALLANPIKETKTGIEISVGDANFWTLLSKWTATISACVTKRASATKKGTKEIETEEE
ncbi:hypothetical protein SCHPADRAFT_819503 [Schizopora paradoxa]|uniref:Ubiquitin-like protease family profile domain-containing protein n=1 Tax=Schizopora paradoxa TaxID=27342 RepID=A0A0H2S3T7_9AGAM|nr:hypothetical protein SCHPADRAFT_878714 [Schizopora paradoxa]KLO18644.1 hypothetical protein SCHPADRAFT_819503 [Schizopora paradoxa]